MDSLTQIENQLKRAAESREYYAVDRLTLQYGDAAREAIAALPSGTPAIAEIAKRVLDTLEWARLVVLTGRASTAHELRRIPFLARYMSLPPKAPVAIRIDV